MQTQRYSSFRTKSPHRIRHDIKSVHHRPRSCTKRQHGITWYTRGRSHVQNSRAASLGTPEGAFLYKTAARHRLVHQRALPCTKRPHGIAWYARGRSHVQNGSTASLGTPEGAPMYKTAARHRLVHQRALSCTKQQHGITWYTRGRSHVQNGSTASLGTPRVWQKYKKNVKLYNRPLPYRQEPPLNPEILVTCKISVERGFLSI